MLIKNELIKELKFLQKYNMKGISISTTAKHALKFRVFPRRRLGNLGLSSFMINDLALLEEVLKLFDDEIDYIFVDVEQKQEINLFAISKKIVKKSKVIAVKPNDNTVESLDLLVRNYYSDDLADNNVVVIGTGNLASKIATRLAERQSNVYMKGRTFDKEVKVVNALNLFLPKYTNSIKSFEEFSHEKKQIDLVISALSGLFVDEKTLLPFITKQTLIVDVGINNFSKDFIQDVLSKDINMVRLDTRISLPYQVLSQHDYVTSFFKDTFGQGEIDSVPVVSGGFIGEESSVIVDSIKHPNQVIGIADGSGGVKKDEQLSETERGKIQTIKQAISKGNKTIF